MDNASKEYGRQLLNQGRAAQAGEVFSALLEQGPDPELCNLLGLSCINTQSHRAALAAFSQAVALAPESTTYRMNLGKCLLVLGLHQNARHHLEKAAARLSPGRQLDGVNNCLAMCQEAAAPQAPQPGPRAEKKIRIAFAKLNPQIRIYKQALGLKRTGRYHLTLLAQKYDPALFNGVFDEIVDVSELAARTVGAGNLDAAWQAAVAAQNVDLFHAHAEPNALVHLVMHCTKAPVVYDAYDFSGLRRGLEMLAAPERNAERFCLENAAGIVNKFGPNALDFYREHGYQISAPVLHFEDYCVEEMLASRSAPSANPEEWHLIYAGNAAPASLPPEEYGFAQFHGLARQLNGQGVHLHFFLSPFQYDPDYFKCYRDLAQELPYFHFHDPVDPMEVSRAISGFHFGVTLVAPWPLLRTNQKYATGNKLSTYLEAGLPIIVNSELEAQADTLRTNRIGLVIDYDKLSHMRQMLDACDFPALQGNVMRFRQEFSLNRQTPRLEEFYAEILNH